MGHKLFEQNTSNHFSVHVGTVKCEEGSVKLYGTPALKKAKVELYIHFARNGTVLPIQTMLRTNVL